MSVLDYVYSFLKDTLFTGSWLPDMTWSIGGQSVDLAQWFSIGLTCVSGVLLCVLLIRFILWIFKFVSGLFRW